MARAGHSAGGQREREQDVGEGVNNHVNDDAVEPFQAVLVIGPQLCSVHHPAAQVEEHHAVEHHSAELGEENPEVVAPETLIFMLRTQPTLTGICWLVFVTDLQR